MSHGVLAKKKKKKIFRLQRERSPWAACGAATRAVVKGFDPCSSSSFLISLDSLSLFLSFSL